MQEVQLY